MNVIFLPEYITKLSVLAGIGVFIWWIIQCIKVKEMSLSQTVEFCSGVWNSNIIFLRWRYVVALLLVLLACYVVLKLALWFGIIVTVVGAMIASRAWTYDNVDSVANKLSYLIPTEIVVMWIALLCVLLFHSCDWNAPVLEVDYLLFSAKGWANLGVLAIVSFLGYHICPYKGQYDKARNSIV